MYLILLLKLGLPDCTIQHQGPCIVWQAHTTNGAKFLKNLPPRFAAPYIQPDPDGGIVVGYAEYNPKWRSLAVVPGTLQTIEDMAKDAKLIIWGDTWENTK